eukprot:scaffold17413_cov55-Cyclotella_meneghiniana.AAC.4
MDTSFGCAPPEPIQIPVLNAITNKTTYLDIPREVHDVEITFNYEIRHASDVHWDEGADSEEDSDGGWFSKLFGGRMLNNKTEGNETGTILEQLESDMVSTIWNVVLNDSDMTFNTDGECAGLFISEQNETLLTDDANAGFQAATEDETMLLGLSVYPADEVNPDGCINSSDRCTSINGKLSATYTGNDEFGITTYIVDLLNEGMKTGAFLSDDHPALRINFVTVTEMDGNGQGGVVPPIKTDRGTIWQQMQEEAEENPISTYGKLFVGLLVVLSVGFVLSKAYKQKLRGERKEPQADEVSDDSDAIFTQREEQVSDETLRTNQVDLGDNEGEQKPGGWAMFGNFFGKEELQSVVVMPEVKNKNVESPMIDHVALDVPKCSSDEVEMSLAKLNVSF